MSKNTFFHTRFWQDSYVSELTQSEKLLFIYCFTSSFLSLSGIYEISLKSIASETELDREEVKKILEKFEKDRKIIYREGWICVVNYPKYQNLGGPMIAIALKRELKLIPGRVLRVFIDYGYPIDTLSISVRDKDRDKDREQGDEGLGEEVPDEIMGEELEEATPNLHPIRHGNVNNEYGQDFLEVWDLYPKKVGKRAANAVWEKLRPPADRVRVSILANKKTREWQEEGGRYVPHFATWLRGERWEDEVKEKIIKVLDLSK